MQKAVKQLTGVGIAVLIVIAVAVNVPVLATTPSCDEASLCGIEKTLTLENTLAALAKPTVATPDWLVPKTLVTYSVETRGIISANLAEFKQQANSTLNDARGWSRLDAVFTEVATGGSFTLVLSEASSVPLFSPTGCSSTYSCTVGRYVIINQDRWLGATDPWNAGGGSLRDYRHMVVNHETGHWLGHGHEVCGGSGQPAPVMQQQSIGLQGCAFNPWPLQSEIWSSRI
jgi:hypothetical protein